MNKKLRVAKASGYITVAISILFSMTYLAKRYDALVLPFLLGVALFIFPLDWYIKKAEKGKTINKPFNWIIYSLIAIGFIWSLFQIS